LYKIYNIIIFRSFSPDPDTPLHHYSKTVNTDYEETGCLSGGYIYSDNSFQPDWGTNYRGDYKGQTLEPIFTRDLLSWAFQVARGMEYLSQRRVSFLNVDNVK